ncbi:MAG: hypothetical protein RR459_03180 [Christensenellaceae bacterium]
MAKKQINKEQLFCGDCVFAEYCTDNKNYMGEYFMLKCKYSEFRMLKKFKACDKFKKNE